MRLREIRRKKRERRNAVRQKWLDTYRPAVSPQQRRRELRCFWTPPLGHEWNSRGEWQDTCLICGKLSTRVEGGL